MTVKYCYKKNDYSPLPTAIERVSKYTIEYPYSWVSEYWVLHKSESHKKEDIQLYFYINLQKDFNHFKLKYAFCTIGSPWVFGVKVWVINNNSADLEGENAIL